MKDILLTQESVDKMKAELEDLKNNKMPEIVKRIEEAIKLGDLSENAEYHSAKDEQGMIAGKIREYESILSSAVVVEKTSEDCVAIGSKILVVDESGKERNMEIVDATQADPTSGKISNESPLGKAFLGKCSGTKVEVELPSGKKSFHIKTVA